ncbi:unnamed protein product [Allacma fusca]|uniref:15-oxoprostaglandin 13-reductase n=1 Tax=Allacma fusca TaxID=39272 RepID=A0A8J2LQB1_9HEXA|nr:unnamed protein product [Allacma fusca]
MKKHCTDLLGMSASTGSKVAKKFILVQEFDGLPKLSDFKLVEEPLVESLCQGEILAKAEWLSVDPYMRCKFVDPVAVGQVLKGAQVARVLKSRCSEFPEVMPKLQGLPDSYAIGSLGMPGNAAYYGLIDLCQPKKGDVLVVNGAGGAVGSLVGQIGKIKGCTVLAFAGTEEKLQWMKNDLGFDHVFNYKDVNLNETFKKFAPEGIDIFFDNVGGDFVGPVMKHMAKSGRYCKSGSISEYNYSNDYQCADPKAFPEFKTRKVQLKKLFMESITIDWFDRINKIQAWILEGKIKVRETVVESFENMPQAFIDLFEGKNVGKMVIKA